MFSARRGPAPRHRLDADPGVGIKVAVVEEHEIVRRGLVSTLCEEGSLRVTTAVSNGPVADDIDIAVVSPAAARRERFPCPIVVCSDDHEWLHSVASENEVVGVLPRNTLTGAQLRATVYAAAAGLHVYTQLAGAAQQALEPRYRLVLELMAEGCTTREMAERMSYSERTIKKLITLLQDRFETRTRAQTVAEAIRRGLI